MRVQSLLATATFALVCGSASAQEEIKERDADKLAKGIQDFFAYRMEEQYTRANKELESLEKDLSKVVKEGDPLRFVNDWRLILRKGGMDKKSDVKISTSGGFGLTPIELPCPVPVGDGADQAFDGHLKVHASFPRDAKTKEYPVIVALHPIEPETGMALKDMRSSKELTKWSKEWAEETYPKELRDTHIILVPIMDLVVVSDNGLTADRPNWDTDWGATWAVTALRDVVLRNSTHDGTRIFFDGHGVGAKAAIQLSAQMPGLMTGAIVRGAPPNQIDFVNCRHSALLFVGDESKEFFDNWSQEPGFRLQHAATLDAAGLAEFIAANQKNFCPDRVELVTRELSFASSFWVTILEFDRTMESKEPLHIVAEVNREANEILVTTSKRITRFVVYLNDALLDLDREIKILHKRETEAEEDESAPEVVFSGTKKRLLKETLLLAFSQAHGNTGEVYVSEIVVDL